MSRFNLKSGKEMKPSHNIAPMSLIAVITQENPHFLDEKQWSLVPWWSKIKKYRYNYINVRSDKIFKIKTTAKLVREKRCLIPASGFYEWKKVGKNKIPHYFTCSDDLIAFAGVYSLWEKDGDILYSTAIITTDANDIVEDVHARMPLILNRDDEIKWISSDLSDKDINELLKPFSSNKMKKIIVSKKVNSPTNDDPSLIEEVSLTDIIKKVKTIDGKESEQSSLDDFF